MVNLNYPYSPFSGIDLITVYTTKGKCFEKSVGVQAMDSEWSNDLVTHWEDPHFMGNQELTIYYI